MCCEDEGKENPEEPGQQLHALTSLRLLLEVFIRKELEFLTYSMYQLRLGVCGRREARLTATYSFSSLSTGNSQKPLTENTPKKAIDNAPSIPGSDVFGGVFFSLLEITVQTNNSNIKLLPYLVAVSQHSHSSAIYNFYNINSKCQILVSGGTGPFKSSAMFPLGKSPQCEHTGGTPEVARFLCKATVTETGKCS